jgi:hypothetical protein
MLRGPKRCVELRAGQELLEGRGAEVHGSRESRANRPRSGKSHPAERDHLEAIITNIECT